MNNNLRQFFDLSDELHVVTDLQGIVLEINPRAQEIYGLDSADLVGKNLREFIHPEDRARSAVAREQTQNSGSIEDFENRVINADGKIVHMRWRGKVDPERCLFFIVGCDISDYVGERVRSSTLDSRIDQVVAGVAHEINNPVTVIHGAAELIRRGISADVIDREKLSTALERIERTSLRISRIIKSMRLFARNRQNSPLLATALSKLIEDTLDQYRNELNKNSITLRVGEIPDLTIQCQPTQISQVFINLLSNSLDAVSELQERWISIDFDFSDPEDLLVIFTDSGTGIPLAVQQRLMEPFFSTKRPGLGTGLGLAISKGIVEAHGGTLSLDTEANNTRFVIRIPKNRSSQTKCAPLTIVG